MLPVIPAPRRRRAREHHLEVHPDSCAILVTRFGGAIHGTWRFSLTCDSSSCLEEAIGSSMVCEKLAVVVMSMPADFMTKKSEQKLVDRSVAYATNAANAGARGSLG